MRFLKIHLDKGEFFMEENIVKKSSRLKRQTKKDKVLNQDSNLTKIKNSSDSDEKELNLKTESLKEKKNQKNKTLKISDQKSSDAEKLVSSLNLNENSKTSKKLSVNDIFNQEVFSKDEGSGKIIDEQISNLEKLKQTENSENDAKISGVNKKDEEKVANEDGKKLDDTQNTEASNENAILFLNGHQTLKLETTEKFKLEAPEKKFLLSSKRKFHKLREPKAKKLLSKRADLKCLNLPEKKEMLSCSKPLVLIASPEKQTMLDFVERKKIKAPIEKLMLETFIKVKKDYEKSSKKKGKNSKTNSEKKLKTEKSSKKSSSKKTQNKDENLENLALNNEKLVKNDKNLILNGEDLNFKEPIKKSKQKTKTSKKEVSKTETSSIKTEDVKINENSESMVNQNFDLKQEPDENQNKMKVQVKNKTEDFEEIKTQTENNNSFVKIKIQDETLTKNPNQNSLQNLNALNENSENDLKQEPDEKKPVQIKKRVLMATSEAQPFCATGGLADVSGSLPRYINQENAGIEIRTILPLYSNISYYFRCQFKFIGYIYVTLSWRKEYCGVFEYEYNGVKYYFIDNEQYFKRDLGVYGYFDDAERFAFFSKAVLEVLPLIDYFPDIIHVNDWETALVPVYLKTMLWDERYSKIRTVLTIHNIQYQGRFSKSVLVDVFGIDERFSNILDFDNDVNVLKGGIVTCDKLIAVSPSYAEEIKQPEYGGGLHGIVSENSYKLCGILNGLDYEFYNPATDNVIYANYSKNDLNNKALNKMMLQREFYLEENLNKPIIAFCSRMNFLKGFEMIKNCIERLISENSFEFVGVGSGEREYEDFFRYLNSKYPKNVHVSVGYSLELGRKIYAGADIYLMPSMTEPCGLSQLVACRYGVVPIVRETGGLKDTIRDFGNLSGGNGYTFKNASINDLEYSIRRAVSDYSNRAEWTKKVEKVMSLDFSWKNTAKNYIDLYLSL